MIVANMFGKSNSQFATIKIIIIMRSTTAMCATMMRMLLFMCIVLLTTATVTAQTLPAQKLLDIAADQYDRAYVTFIKDPSGQVPVYGVPEKSTWETESPASPFTGGFFGGIFWLLYENSVNIGAPNEQWLQYAWEASKGVASQDENNSTHDIGFTLMATFGNGYEITKNESYLEILQTGAATLSTRYSPIVQCTRSWNSDVGFLVIIDNMMNIELLFYAGQLFGNQTWTDMAFHHANRTLHEHFRVDNSTWHVLEYNETDGTVIRKETNQGYADWSTWTRGQAWSIHGFGTSYSYTKHQPFLDKSIAAADLFLRRLHKEVNDSVPFWDFDAPWTNDGQTPPIRDTSAGAIAASGMLHLATLTEPSGPKNRYFIEAVNILSNLSTYNYNIWDHPEYQLPGLLTQAVGSLPANYEVSVAQIYGEFYFTQALVRYSQLIADWSKSGLISKHSEESKLADSLMERYMPRSVDI